MIDLVGFAPDRLTARAAMVGTWHDGGTLEIYSGTRPASNGGAITSQVKLVEFEIPDPAGEAEGGVFTADAIPQALVIADGIAAWARSKDSAGAAIADYDVGGPGSGAAVEMDNLSLITGALVSVLSFAIAES